MSILAERDLRVVIQGITGREGTARAKLMKEYGTNVVAGVTPGRKGETVERIPVYDTVEEAAEKQGPLDASVIFIPAPLVKEAAFEALDAGIKLLVIVPDRVPVYDVLEMVRKSEEKGARFVGPNTLGLISPGKAVLGMIGGRAESAKEWFKPGPVGVTSRSGGITSAVMAKAPASSRSCSPMGSPPLPVLFARPAGFLPSGLAEADPDRQACPLSRRPACAGPSRAPGSPGRPRDGSACPRSG